MVAIQPVVQWLLSADYRPSVTLPCEGSPELGDRRSCALALLTGTDAHIHAR